MERRDMTGTHDGYGGHLPSPLEILTEEIRELNKDKGWRAGMGEPGSGPRTGPWFAAYIALIGSEASEALEAYRVKDWSSTREDGKPMGVGPELADVLIRVLDTADIWGVDIEYELRRVIKYGWTRPYQHGGKIL
jgi:NTP pyrophosphatase (non-canonical NTP hydrolase)